MIGIRMCTALTEIEQLECVDQVHRCFEIYSHWWIRLCLHTQIQTTKAISNEFWNKMKWIKLRTMAGRWNQKYSSEGFTRPASCPCLLFGSTSWAKRVIMCSNLAPTRSRSCHSIQLKSIWLLSKRTWWKVMEKHIDLQLMVKRPTKSMYAILH